MCRFHFHLCCLWSSNMFIIITIQCCLILKFCGLIVCKCNNKKQKEEIRYPITLLELLLGELVHLLLFLVFASHDIVFLVFFGSGCFVHLMVNFFIMWSCSYLWSLPMQGGTTMEHHHITPQ